MSAEAKDLILKLLHKQSAQRMNIKDALDHPWFVGANSQISQIRKEADSEGNEMMKFISYSNVDPNLVEEASKKSQGSNSPLQNYNA